MNRIKTITPLTRGLPKTGQKTSTVTGDDGTYQRGWWLGRTVDGNKIRFVEKEIVTDEKVIIDKATGLMWPKSLTGAANDLGVLKNFADCITWCEGLTFSGFSDWRLANLFEMISLFNAGVSEPCVYESVFSNWLTTWQFWTSTVQDFDNDNYHFISYNEKMFIASYNRETNLHFIPVRDV